MMEARIEKTMDALRRNNMAAYYVENGVKAAALAFSLIADNASVAVGGSATLSALGVIDRLRSGPYRFLDRYADMDDAAREAVFTASLSADVLLTSSNAVTENGELYNVDGTCNRIGGITYGPKSVIVIAGKNKIVPDLEAAILRVKTVAAPLNCKRLSRRTYCFEKGVCASVAAGKGAEMTAGCQSPDRICRSYVVTGPQAVKERIKVILVNESLGF